jgi:small GTP-binding protein
MSKTELFNKLLTNFMNVVPDVEAIIVSDDDGLIIASKLDEAFEEKTDSISVLSSLVNPILERIRYEFSFKKFGTASFETEDSRILFVSAKDDATVSIILNTLASIDKTAPYAYFLAEKSAQILTEEEIDRIQTYIPTFEYDERAEFERLKNQIYQMRITGGEYKFKFIIVGDHEVGKTSIIMRFVENRFSMDYRATIGLNIMAHNYNFLDTMIHLMIWDIGAQKFFRRVRRTYYQGAHSAFLVFDLTNRSSFDHLENWYDELKGFVSKDIPIVVVGNKTDLKEERQVSYQEGVSLANKLKASYIETSAKTGENVEDAFSLIS